MLPGKNKEAGMNEGQAIRREAKTVEQRFLHTLMNYFEFSAPIAKAVLSEAQIQLTGKPGSLKMGQQRVILAAKDAGHGRSLRETKLVEVIWTIDAGREDNQVLAEQGRIGLRRHRIRRLLDEALEQGAVATQEDLAQALQVTPRTIQRDFAALKAQGIWLPGRGNLRGIGRGQTHKAEIIRHWLQGETYDQIVVHTHHTLTSIQRYIQTFTHVIELYHQGFAPPEIALLVQISVPLVGEYLAVWSQNDTPACQMRLAEQLQRFAQRTGAKKRGQP
jgi:DNA-binding transcriptional regulator YhcF (GntR family)